MASMKSQLAGLLLASAMLSAPPPQPTQRKKYAKPPLTNSQKKVRAKNKAAKQARKNNR